MRSISRVLFLACALAVAQLSAFAAGSVSQSITQLGTTDVYVVTFYWIGDAGTGSVPATVAQGMQGLSGYQFIGAEFSPGTPAPTAGYTVKINSGVGVDLLGGNGASLSATAPSSAAPSNSATPIIGAVSLVISGNTAAGAQGRVLAYFQKPGLSSPVRISGGSGSGSVSSVTIAGTGFEITVAGTCTITTTGTCTLSVPADFRLPGTVNKITVTQPATGAVLTIQDGFTLTVNGNATVSGTNTGDQTLYNQTIQDEGTPLTQRSVLNFAGGGVVCADAGGKTTCTINSGTTIATTTSVIKGDGAGNGVAATPGTDYVVPAGNVATATALAANPVDCTSVNTFAVIIAANGNLSCDYERLPSNAQTGTSYTILSTDLSKFITFSNAASIAVVLPQGTGSFSDGFWFIAKNIGAGTVTITPTTSTISGASSITLETGEFAVVRSDGTNYEAATNRIIQGSNITLTKARAGTTVAGSASGGTGNAASVVTTTFSATPTFTCPSSSAGTVTNFVLSTALTSNITSSTLASCTSGQIVNFKLTQDGTGGRNLVWPTGFSQACTISLIANSTTKVSFFWDGTAAQLLSCNSDLGPAVAGPEQSAFGTPASSAFYCWMDSTSHSWSCKTNGSSTISNLVVAKDCNALVAGNFVNAISSAGVVTCGTPSGGGGGACQVYRYSPTGDPSTNLYPQYTYFGGVGASPSLNGFARVVQWTETSGGSIVLQGDVPSDYTGAKTVKAYLTYATAQNPTTFSAATSFDYANGSTLNGAIPFPTVTPSGIQFYTAQSATLTMTGAVAGGPMYVKFTVAAAGTYYIYELHYEVC